MFCPKLFHLQGLVLCIRKLLTFCVEIILKNTFLYKIKLVPLPYVWHLYIFKIEIIGNLTFYGRTGKHYPRDLNTLNGRTGNSVPQCHVIFKIFWIYNYTSLFHNICLKGLM
jgi:hypothetical protein